MQLRKQKGSPSLVQGLGWEAGGDTAAGMGGPLSGDPIPRATQRHQTVLSKSAGFILMLLWLGTGWAGDREPGLEAITPGIKVGTERVNTHGCPQRWP